MERKKKLDIPPKFIATAEDRGSLYGLGQTAEEALDDFGDKVNKLYNTSGGMQGYQKGQELFKAAKAVEIKPD